MRKVYKVLKPVYVGPVGRGEIVTDGFVQLNDATGEILSKKGVVVEEKPKRKYKKSESPATEEREKEINDVEI